MSDDIRPEAAGVTLEDVGLAFGATAVLKGVSLKIRPGEFFTFLGPSGSGKSTLLRAIAGFGPPPTGRITIGGDDVTRLPPWKRNVGMVFQSYALWPHMTVKKNVAFGLEERRLPAEEITRRVAAALDLVDLKEFAARRPSQLSGGQQQRVALARTIVVEPRVLLLDEPLSNLDANLRIQMRRDILALQRKLKLTTIFVTHDQEEANTTSDRIAVLDQGVIQQVGSPMALYDNPANRFVAAFLGTANMIDGRIERAGNRMVFAASDGVAIVLAAGERREGPATAMFRPQHLNLRSAGAPVEGPALAGTIEGREFLGHLIRYAVAVGDHVILVDDSHQAGRANFAVGDKVSLVVDAAQVRFVAA
jgi:iron(III) transport system ATP-binding protein